MRSRIQPILSTVAILILSAVNAADFATAGDSAQFVADRATFLLVAERDPASQPQTDETNRRAKSLQQGLQQLGLSKKQMDDIGKITTEFRKNVEPLGPSAQALATERNKLVNQGAEKDRKRIAEIDLEIGKIRKQVIEARSRLQARLMEILTPEQRAKFQSMIRQGGQSGQPGAAGGK